MNAAYAASIATLSMRTATAVSKCVLTGPGSSTVLATASCDARFALAQKAQNRRPHPARDRPALSASRARALLGRMHGSRPRFGFARVSLSSTKLLLLAVLRALSGRLEPRKFVLASLSDTNQR